jgi:hypothetical protein
VVLTTSQRLDNKTAKLKVSRSGILFVALTKKPTFIIHLENMTAIAIREKLQDYIKTADDRKIRAIYLMLENDIEQAADWWKTPAFVKTLDKEYKNWQQGRIKGYTIDETATAVEHLRKARGKK